MRVPLTNSSLTDAVFEVERDTTAEEVNQLLSEASDTYLKNILRVRHAASAGCTPWGLEFGEMRAIIQC